MHRITVGKWTFRYIVGPFTVGIITPTRKKHVASIAAVRQGRRVTSQDYRVAPEEIAAYIVKERLQ